MFYLLLQDTTKQNSIFHGKETNRLLYSPELDRKMSHILPLSVQTLDPTKKMLCNPDYNTRNINSTTIRSREAWAGWQLALRPHSTKKHDGPSGVSRKTQFHFAPIDPIFSNKGKFHWESILLPFFQFYYKLLCQVVSFSSSQDLSLIRSVQRQSEVWQPQPHQHSSRMKHSMLTSVFGNLTQSWLWPSWSLQSAKRRNSYVKVISNTMLDHILSNETSLPPKSVGQKEYDKSMIWFPALHSGIIINYSGY